MQVLSGRSVLVQTVVDGLGAPDAVGVVLVGEAGIGKTAIAREVAHQLQDSVQVIPVRGGVGLRLIPYGALSRYLVGLSPADAGSPSAVLRHFMRHIAPELRHQAAPVILVDDAHNLDNESALLIMQLATARKVKVLATARQVPGPVGEFARAAKDGLLAHHLVEPLTLPDIRELCEQVLGGPVLTGTARMLAVTTRGNPLLLTMLLEQFRGQGYLVARNGVWRSQGPRPAIGAPLADLLLHGLGERSGAELAALEAVAVQGRVPLASLEAEVERGVLARLAQERLIEVDPSNGQFVSLRHPLHAEALRGSITAARALDRAETVRAALPEPPRDPSGLAAWVASALRTSSPVGDPVLLRSARVANRLHDPRLALDALRAVREPSPTPAYLLEAAWVQAADGNRQLARVLLDEGLRTVGDAAVARDGAVLSLHLRRYLQEGTRALHGDVERWAGLLDASVDDDGGDPQAREAARAAVRLLRTSVEVLGGNLRGAADLEAAPVDAGLPAEVRLGHLTLLAHALTRTGRPQAASRALEEAQSLLEESPEHLLTYREAVSGEHLMSLIGTGAYDHARDRFHRCYPPDAESTFLLSGWLDVIDGSRSLQTGRFRDAREHLVLAVEAFRDVDGLHLLEWVSGAAAYACARAGDGSGARSLIDAHGPLEGGSDAVARRMGDAHVAAALGHLGEEGAVERLRSIAARAEGRYSLLVVATALDHAAVLGDRTALRPLAEVTRAFDGEAGRFLHRFAAAAAAGDRDALVTESEASRRRGYLPLAVRCLEEAALAGPAGAVARGIDRQLAALRAQLRVVPGGSAVPPAHGARLTRGEQVIVKLVAAGHTNREIAEIRGISTRTVEGHLYRIFAKLGISRREVLQQPDVVL
ncbi:DNA-binding CsgD family transcriptional regulator/tetratricopeptide (TPR) repeat protein [Arthrobacter sp. CAN_A2]|uniref:AAA family ATPase n=1 Tax=Arthrobacter sp. CAN_A2 TaxID=2787718 RepID=UPI0018EF904B